MEANLEYWKDVLDIPLDTDERIAIQIMREKNLGLATSIEVDNASSI